MAADPRVSVVLLTYDCAHRLTPVLDRLGTLDTEIVAVDNASRDGTVDVLREHPAVTTVVALPVNTGAAGRNVGVQHVRTPYVAFCDDDGWWEPEAPSRAADALDAHDRLAVVNARILVGREHRLDPICAEMAASPLPDRDGVPGRVLAGFMAGAVVVRVAAYRQVGGYDPRYFIGGEEETLTLPLLRAGWTLRYLPEVVAHHRPSIANAPHLRAVGMRNTLWAAWRHRRPSSALRRTAFVLADTPKDSDWITGCAAALRGLPAILRRRQPLPPAIEDDLDVLDRRRAAARRPLLTRHDALRELGRTG